MACQIVLSSANGKDNGFVEVKAPGKKMRTLQKVRNEMLTSLGFKTYVLDNVKNIGEILDDIQRP